MPLRWIIGEPSGSSGRWLASLGSLQSLDLPQSRVVFGGIGGAAPDVQPLLAHVPADRGHGVTSASVLRHWWPCLRLLCASLPSHPPAAQARGHDSRKELPVFAVLESQRRRRPKPRFRAVFPIEQGGRIVWGGQTRVARYLFCPLGGLDFG